MALDADALRAAAHQLSSPLRTEREAAEGVLVTARDAAVPFLIEVLEEPPAHGSPVPRAALLVGALHARDALPALFKHVEKGSLTADEKPFVARALAEILDGRDAFDDRARAVLETLAKDDDRYTRAFAAQAFGSLGDLRSKARVQALAQDRDSWVREKANAVLTRLAETEAIASQSDIRPADFAALVERAEAEGGALKPFLDDLGDQRRAVRDAAVAELVRAGSKAVPFLIEKLNQPQTRARIGAAHALGRLQSTQAAGPLLIAATAPARAADEVELRAVALRSLANCLTGTEEGLAPSIVPLARDPDRFVRAAALLSLGRLADRAGMRAVVDAILEDDPFVVESAAVALSEGAREEDREIVRPLLVALERRAARPAVREAILIALSRVQIDDAPLRVRVRHRVRREIGGQTAATRKASIALLERLYADDDPPPVIVVDDVLIRLSDDHPEVRVVSASFVRTHLPAGMPGAVARLVGALRRGERTVGLLCLEALRRHDTQEALAALELSRSDEMLAPRASELLDGWVPSSSTWLGGRASEPPRPAMTPTHRATRDETTTVEARFPEETRR